MRKLNVFATNTLLILKEKQAYAQSQQNFLFYAFCGKKTCTAHALTQCSLIELEVEWSDQYLTTDDCTKGRSSCSTIIHYINSIFHMTRHLAKRVPFAFALYNL